MSLGSGNRCLVHQQLITKQGCQPHPSSNMENMTSPASDNKAPCRHVASRPNSQLQWGGGGVGGGGGEVHKTVPETTLNIVDIADFLVSKSTQRQIANFLNYLGDY